VSALPLADGPAMYFGGTIMTFALPYGAFIAAAVALFYLFRARHSGPRLRWSTGNAAEVSSVITREPGPAPAPEVTAEVPASADDARINGTPVVDDPVVDAPAADARPADAPPADTADGEPG